MSAPDENSKAEPKSPGKTILLGLGCWGIALALFLLFYAMERSGSGATVHWFIALLYNLGGKWLVGGIFAALGALVIGVGITDLFNGKPNDDAPQPPSANWDAPPAVRDSQEPSS